MEVLKGIGYVMAAIAILAIVLGGGLVLFLLVFAVGVILRVGFVVALIAFGLREWFESKRSTPRS